MFPQVIGPRNGPTIGQLSTYANALPAESRNRYVKKIIPIGFVDPYVVSMSGEDFPTTVTTGHIVDYLVNHVSPISGVEFRKDKSFQAYRKFEAGFVTTVHGTVLKQLHVVRGKVVYSLPSVILCLLITFTSAGFTFDEVEPPAADGMGHCGKER